MNKPNVEELHIESAGALASLPVDVDKIDPDNFSNSFKRHCIRKVDMRLVPLCSFAYLMNYLDRSNIGNSKILNQETGDSLLQQTGITEVQYSIILTVFGIAYTLFDIPSNWIMKRYTRPSHWLGFLMLSWGCLTIGFAWVNNFATVLAIRFLIGVFEAGFFPGIVYLITFWYPPDQRSLRIAFVLASATLAGAFGGCIAYGVGFLNNSGGLEGFRWLFIIEGTLTVLSIGLVVRFLPDWPSSAPWLSEDEKQCIDAQVQAAAGSGFTREHASRREILETCFSPRMVAHYLSYLTNTIVLNSLAYFTPTIVSSLGYQSITAQLMTVPPWAVGYIFSLLIAYSADRLNARGLHIMCTSFLSGIGFLVCCILPPDAYASRYGCLFLVACGAFPSAAPMVGWVTSNVPSKRTVGLAAAINNATTGVASIVSVWIWPAQDAPSGFLTGNIVCAVSSFVTTALTLGLLLTYQKLNMEGHPDITGVQRIWKT